MGLFTSMATSESGMTAHRLWMDVISSNLANSESTRTAEGGAFRRQQIIFSADNDTSGVKVEQVINDPAPLRQVFDPGHPDADANGIVMYPNVEPVREMVDMLNATRAFEANAVALTMSRTMLQRALEIGR